MSHLIIFRIIAFFEGLSFILLLGYAMPLKYVYGEPQAVSIIGMIHGVLFIMYCAYLVVVLKKYALSNDVGIKGVVAGLLPFGTFVFDVYVRRQVDSSVQG